jgi:hypothetical protein
MIISRKGTLILGVESSYQIWNLFNKIKLMIFEALALRNNCDIQGFVQNSEPLNVRTLFAQTPQ